MAKRVSIKDIAEKVGVSTALVSYVINGQEKEKRVGKEIVKRIRQVAQDLNYRPNQIARSLRKGITNTIGLIVADIANPFFSHLVRVIEDEASNFNYVVIIGSSDEDSNKSTSLTEIFLNRQVDGFILIPSEGDNELVQSLIKRNIPLVLIDRCFPDIESSYIILDNHNATHQATIQLIKKGCRRILMVAYNSSLFHMNERVRGYIDAMTEKDLQDFICVEVVDSQNGEVDERMDQIVQKTGAEAIVFANNTLSIAGLYAIKRNNIRIPENLMVIGFDGTEAFDFFTPPITYIEQPLVDIGKKAVHTVLEQINGSESRIQISLPSKLIQRQSG